MRLIKLLSTALLATGFLITIQSCERVRGCTDPTATNYNSNATVDDGSCVYNGQATFYFDQNGSNASVTINGQTANVTSNYQNGAPNCGGTGCANFTLPAGTYNYSASSASTSWNGPVTVNANSCALVKLAQSTGSVTFYTNNSNYGTITVTISGSNGTLSAISGTPQCGAQQCATFDLSLGNYAFTATSNVPGVNPWSGNVNVTTADNCYLEQF